MTDSSGLFDTAEVLVVVGSVNDAPVFPTGVLERSVNEDALARRAVGAPVTATRRRGREVDLHACGPERQFCCSMGSFGPDQGGRRRDTGS